MELSVSAETTPKYENIASYKQMYVNASPKPYIQHQERMS